MKIHTLNYDVFTKELMTWLNQYSLCLFSNNLTSNTSMVQFLPILFDIYLINGGDMRLIQNIIRWILEDEMNIFEYKQIKERVRLLMNNRCSILELYRSYIDMYISYSILSPCLQGDKWLSFQAKTQQHLYDDEYVRIPLSLMNYWNISEDILFGQGLKYLPDKISLLTDELLLWDYTEINMYVLSDANNRFGSAALLNKDLLLDVSEKYQDDFYIIPISVHELITAEVTGNDIEVLFDILRRVNENQLDSEDFLSQSIYRFKRDNGIISRIWK